MTTSKISVVIPVKNEAAKIAACLTSLSQQTVKPDEILVIDSGSTDGTLELVRQFKDVSLIEIQPEEFNHGETRNVGVRETTGDIVIMTVGDARATDEHWIQRLLDALAEDVAAVCGLQVVEASSLTNPVEWLRRATVPQIKSYQFSAGEFESLPPEAKQRAASLDNVTMLYRRAALESIPFRKVTYGEDMLWAIDALCAGMKLAYNPAATVYHYHLENYSSSLKKSIAVASMRYLSFGVEPLKPKLLFHGVRALVLLARTSGLSLKEKYYWLKNNWTCLLGTRRGVALVTGAIRQNTLDRLFTDYCGSPPIPLKL